MLSPLTPDTLVYGFTSASDPQISPDGSRIAYVLGRVSRDDEKAESQVWLMNRDGSNRRQLTFGGKASGLPRWSPDGAALAFVSDRVETAGLFVLPMQGGEAREVTRHPGRIAELDWAPDGSRIAFTAPFDPANPGGDKPKPGAPPPVRVTSRIDYKQDTYGYLGDSRTQVFIADVNGGGHRMVTSTPAIHSAPTWSPGGDRLLVRLAFDNGHATRLALIDAAGAGEPRYLTPEGGVVSTWAWSPDGLRVAYTGDLSPTGQTDFFLFDLATAATRRVTDDLPCLPDGGFAPILPGSMPAWLDDRRVAFHAFHRGRSGTWVIDLETGMLEEIESENELRAGFSVDRERRYAAQGMASLERAGEVVLVDLRDGRREVLTGYSVPVFAASPPARWERFEVQRGGFTTEAWLLLPPDFDPAKRYPLVLDVHGGPQGYYGYGFNPIQQALATSGIAVAYCNPRGSSSYGRRFTAQVVGDWGGEDYLDLMAVVDRLLERPCFDPERTGIWGYSYGGYMTAWTIARTHRFRAAACGAPCFDLESMFGTSDLSHAAGMVDWTGAPWEAREWYATHSPSQFAHNTRTPTLIIQGEADERCPIGQGEQMFVTLKKVGCEVEFARYPGGSHLFLRTGPPSHRKDVIERIVAWFHRHLDAR